MTFQGQESWKQALENAVGNIEDVWLCQNCHLCLIKHQT